MSRRKKLHTDFEAAFTAGFVFTSGGRDIPVRQLEAGKLNVPSGELIACDPIHVLTALTVQPFCRRVPIGIYPVQLAIAELGVSDDRVACARLRFGNATPVRWEPALVAGEKLPRSSKLRQSKVSCFCVDSGSACYVDAASLAGQTEESEFKTEWALSNRTLQELHRSGAGAVVPVGSGGANAVGFDTGFGDGYYPSFWGFDDTGRIVTLESDFGILLDC